MDNLCIVYYDENSYTHCGGFLTENINLSVEWMYAFRGVVKIRLKSRISCSNTCETNNPKNYLKYTISAYFSKSVGIQ